MQYEPTSTGYHDDIYYDDQYEKEDLMTQAKELQEQMNNPQIYGPDLVFLPFKDKCFSAEDSG